MELFVILINPFQLLTNVIVSSVLFAVGIIFQLDIHTEFIIIIFIVELVGYLFVNLYFFRDKDDIKVYRKSDVSLLMKIGFPKETLQSM